MWFAGIFLRGRSTSHIVLLFICIISFIAFSVGGKGILRYLNGHLDESEPVFKSAKVLYKENDSSLLLESWKAGREFEVIPVNSKVYKAAIRDTSYLVVTTKAGKFGKEWIVGYEIKNDGADSN